MLEEMTPDGRSRYQQDIQGFARTSMIGLRWEKAEEGVEYVYFNFEVRSQNQPKVSYSGRMPRERALAILKEISHNHFGQHLRPVNGDEYWESFEYVKTNHCYDIDQIVMKTSLSFLRFLSSLSVEVR